VRSGILISIVLSHYHRCIFCVEIQLGFLRSICFETSRCKGRFSLGAPVAANASPRKKKYFATRALRIGFTNYRELEGTGRHNPDFMRLQSFVVRLGHDDQQRARKPQKHPFLALLPASLVDSSPLSTRFVRFMSAPKNDILLYIPSQPQTRHNEKVQKATVMPG